MIPLLILTLFSIVWGSLTQDLFVGIGTLFLDNSLFTHPDHVRSVDVEFGENLMIKMFPVLGTGALSTILLLTYVATPKIWINVSQHIVIMRGFRFLNHRYGFDPIFSTFTHKILDLGSITGNTLDRGVLELMGPTGLAKILNKISFGISHFDTGLIPHYALYTLIGFILEISLGSLEIKPQILILTIYTLISLPEPLIRKSLITKSSTPHSH
jgi:NADH-ubiquinone oxidoreductase chain 5